MSKSTCQLPLRVFVFVLASLACLSPLGFPDFYVVLFKILSNQSTINSDTKKAP